jgi:Zn-dependent protease with chaperone function
MPPVHNSTAYRYPTEGLILSITLLVILGVIALTATATVCGGVVVVALAILLSYYATNTHHINLIQQAKQVSPDTMPDLAHEVDVCRRKLQPGKIEVFVAPSRQLNAYTFGLSTPKVVVLYSGLLQIMDADELRFIIGHEIGHVRLGHTWLNSLIGGMAGIPSPLFIATALALIFRGWNRACEYSADRAGLLACGSLTKAETALIKLVAPRARFSTAEMSLILQKLDAEDENPATLLGELLATHPLMIRRIEQLRKYAASREYLHLQGLMDQNLV